MISRLGRRVSNLARRASASVLSVASPAIQSSKSSLRSRVKRVFFEDVTVRAIPQSVESNRVLVGLSISSVDTMGARKPYFEIEGSKQSSSDSMDIERGISMQKKFSSHRSKLSEVAPQSSPIPEISLSTDPVELFVLFEKEFQQFIITVQPTEERVRLAEEWG